MCAKFFESYKSKDMSRESMRVLMDICKEKQLSKSVEHSENMDFFRTIQSLSVEVSNSALKHNELSVEDPIEKRLQKREDVFWDIFTGVQSASGTFYSDKITKERLEMQRQLAQDVNVMTPEMREKEEQLYLKKLDDEWRARGTFKIERLFVF